MAIRIAEAPSLPTPRRATGNARSPSPRKVTHSAGSISSVSREGELQLVAVVGVCCFFRLFFCPLPAAPLATAPLP
eukprot:1867507-Prymnesium_polylepis.1